MTSLGESIPHRASRSAQATRPSMHPDTKQTEAEAEAEAEAKAEAAAEAEAKAQAEAAWI